MTKSAYPDAPSLSTGDLTGNDVTASQCSYSIDDSCHFSPFSGDRIDPTSNADPGTAHQSTSRPHGQRHHTLTHGMGLHHEYLPQETNSSIYFLPTQLSMRAGENGANGQTVKISSQSRQRRLSNSEDGTQADSTQGQPPKKRQRRSHARGNTAKNSAATGEAQENSEAAKRNQESGGLRRGSDYRGPRIRWTDGVMEWLDDGDFQWSKLTHDIVMVRIGN